MRRDDSAYQSWLWGEILLFGLLAAGLALFAAYPDLRPTYELPQARLVLDTMVALAAALVAVLAGVRLSVDGRRLDLLLCAGFSTAASPSARRSRSSLTCTTSSRRSSPTATSRRATSCASSRTRCCSSASGGRSATPSSGGPSPRSAHAWHGRSTTASRNTCSRYRHMRRTSRTE